MIHVNRRYVVVEVSNAKELADKLVNQSWCGCNGFIYDGHYYLNDSFSPDGAQEFAVLRKDGDKFVQVESITFSWCSVEKALGYIEDAATYEPITKSFELVVEDSADHGSCALCA